jgi:hypothetical protein
VNRIVSLGAAGVVATVGAVLLVVHRQRVADAVRRFFTATSHPVNLAVFRVVQFGLLAFLAWAGWRGGGPASLGELPVSLRFPPYGTGWLVGRGWADPLLDPQVIAALVFALAVTATMAALGVATRASTIAAAGLALVVLGVPQLFGKVNHSHHLVWFAVLLAASRCGDALSVDAMVRRVRTGAGPPGPSRAYGLPLRIAWLLIGLIYLFPGLHKYATNGLKWALSDNLANRVLVHHAAVGREVPGFVDMIEPVLPLLALAAMALEVVFIVLLFSDRLRRYALIAMIGFHIGTRFLLRIWFFHLVAMYVVFVDWHALGQRLRRRSIEASARTGPGAPTAIDPEPGTAVKLVAGVLLVGVVVTGARGIVDGWPFASYPTFSNLQDTIVVGVEVDVTWRDGRPDETVQLAELVPALDPSQVGGLTVAILTAPDRERRLQGLWELMDRGGPYDPDAIEALEFHRTIRDLRDDRPARRETILRTTVT